jgi:ankyrin repeat protein
MATQTRSTCRLGISEQAVVLPAALLRQVLHLLKTGINTFNADGHTALHLAIQVGAEHLVEDLIADGAGVEARASPTAPTPLHLAAAAGSTAIIPLLITPNTLDAEDADNNTPLQVALNSNHFAAAAVLVAAGAQLCEPGQGLSFTPIPDAFSAVAQGDSPQLAVALIKRLVSDPALAELRAQAVTWSGQYGRTTLHHAACFGHSELVSLLLAAGADKDAVDADGATPLLLAALAGRRLASPGDMRWLRYHSKASPSAAAKAVVAVLLAEGAQANTHNSIGCSALTAAAAVCGQMEVVELLLAALVKECGQQQQEQAVLVSLVADAVALLAMQLEGTQRCSDLLEVVLDVLGPQLLQQVCGDVQQQLQTEFEQPQSQARGYRMAAWDDRRTKGFRVSRLAEALLLGWVQTQQRLHAARQLVVAPLQRLVLYRGCAAGQQQQRWQRQSISRLSSWLGRQPRKLLSWLWPVDKQLQGMVQLAECAAAAGDGGRAHALLEQIWSLYLQQQGQGAASTGASSSIAVPSAGTPPNSGNRAGPGSDCSVSRLVESGLLLATVSHWAASRRWGRAAAPAEVALQRAASFRAPGVYTTFLEAWVAARRELQQVPQEVVQTVVAAVAAAQQQQQRQLHDLEQEQQQQWLQQQQQQQQQGPRSRLLLSASAAAMRARLRVRLMQVRQLCAGS